MDRTALTIMSCALAAASALAADETPTVGERPEARTAEEVALRDQRVLLKRGSVSADLGLSYSHSEQTLFPVARVEQSVLGASGTLRYGLLDDLQLTARLPWLRRRTATYTDGSVTGAASVSKTRETYTGDASFSLLGVASREAMGRPTLLWSLDAVAPTGPGDKGVGGGMVLSKSYDPAVLFAGLSYLHGTSVDPADSRRSLAKHNIGLSAGYTYALNDTLALNTLLTASYRNTRSPDGVAIPPPRERYQLQFGVTWLLARGLFVEPAIAVRLGGDSPDVSFSLNIPYSF